MSLAPLCQPGPSASFRRRLAQPPLPASLSAVCQPAAACTMHTTPDWPLSMLAFRAVCRMLLPITCQPLDGTLTLLSTPPLLPCSLQVDGRDFIITAYHPGTAHWARRPAAYRSSLQLGPHIDERGIQADLEDGVLHVFFPFRPRPQPQRLVVTVRAPVPAPAPVQQPPRPCTVVVQGPACQAAACAAALAPAAMSAAWAAAPACARAACCAPAAARTAPAPAPAAPAAAPAPAAAAPVAPCSFRQPALHRRQARALPAHVKGLYRCAEQVCEGCACAWDRLCMGGCLALHALPLHGGSMVTRALPHPQSCWRCRMHLAMPTADG